MSVSLNTIVNVSVEVSNPTTISSDFNLGLIIGSSTVLTSTNRVKVYSHSTYQADMIEDGFTASSDEYKAAVAYFSQSPVPENVAIGVKLSGESDLQALNACRAFNENFYTVCFAYTTTDSNISSLASAVEAFSIPTILLYQTSDSNCLSTGQSNVLKTIQTAGYNKTCGFYSTQAQFIAGVMGVICGLNSMQPNSMYTLAYKSVVGFNPEAISDTQLAAIKSYNGNVYCQFGRRYNFIAQGVMGSGRYVDQQYMMDAVYFLIQQNTVAGLVSRRVVPQTESGVTDIIAFITTACETLRSIGMIAGGVWTGGNVLELSTGDALPNGYMIQAGSIAAQSAADRAARKSPTIYVALKSAGAIEHVIVQVFVNQ